MGKRRDLPQAVVNGIVFEDGYSVDLVRDSDLRLAVWDGRSISIVEEFSHDGKSFVPGELDSAAQAIYFPTSVSANKSTAVLRTEINAELCRMGVLPEDFAALLTDCIFASWYSDSLVVVPSIFLGGAGPEELSHILKLLNCFSRRPLLLAQCDLRTFNKLPLRFGPTLLICSLRGKGVGEALAGLDGMGLGCAKYFHDGQFLDIPIMKVISNSMMESFESASPGIQVAVYPCQADAYPPDRYYVDLQAEYQPQLLGHRLKTMHQVKKAVAEKSKTPGMMGVVSDVLSICAQDSNTNSSVRGILKKREEEARLDLESRPICVVIEAVLALCHDGGRTRAMVAEITAVANSISEKRGNPLKLVPRATGYLLKTVGLKTEKIGAAGRGVAFDRIMRAQVHHLTSQYQTASSRTPLESCPDCIK